MRSCTGWPSGIWIDEPRRTAPDGSNFQLQHWTHVFDYALVCGDGDWRRRRRPGPQRRVLPSAAGGDGVRCGSAGCPRPARCCRSTRPAAVQLGALKAGRQPAGTRQRPARRPGHGGACGWSKPAAVTPTSSCARPGHGVGAARGRPAGAAAAGRRHTRPRLHGYQIGTELARLELPRLLRRRNCRVGPGCREPPAAVRAVLAAQPRAGAAGRACPPSRTFIRTRSPPRRARTWRCA